MAAPSDPEERSSKKTAFPAKAGTHLSGDGAVERWVPAFAGNAVFRLLTPSLIALGLRYYRISHAPHPSRPALRAGDGLARHRAAARPPVRARRRPACRRSLVAPAGGARRPPRRAADRCPQ